MIRSYGRIIQKKMGKYDKDKSSFQIHTFHSGTKPSDFFGTNILKEGRQIGYVNGSLITAIKEGLIFIADEMNISSPTTMKSLAIALETNINQGIYFSFVEEIISPSNNFHFIACQNFVGTIGRNLVPDSIISRFRILNLCIDIKNSLLGKYNDEKTDIEAEKLGLFMYNLNKSDIRCVQK
jgi:MoxR-like ATPase